MHDKIKSRSRRHIPAVNKVLEALDAVDLPRPIVVATVRRELSALRESDKIFTFEDVFEHVLLALDRHVRSRLQPVINGTGVILHTNFGRAPLSQAAVESMAHVAASYSNLEFDLASGLRGHRAGYLEQNLAILCGAEAATVVNNCAAALVLIVRHFTKTKPEIIISRGEIVQIGGGFRIGEILEASGARLREVGATNKTTARDYERAIDLNTGLILKVHRSNFFMDGFVASPSTKEIAQVARKRRVPFVVDLGSGALESTDGLASGEEEPTPAQELKSGADLVCFSGDKLFGGPQAGIIAGKKTIRDRAQARTFVPRASLRQIGTGRVAGDGRSSSSRRAIRNPRARAVTNFEGRAAIARCRYHRTFARFARANQHRPRGRESGRRYFAKIDHLLCRHRHRPARLLRKRVRGSNARVNSSGRRLYRKQVV